MSDNVSNELKIYELSLLWKEAEYNFAYWDKLPSLDWDKAYKEALPAVLATKNIYEYYLELMKFLALLRDGHTNVWFPDSVHSAAEYTSRLPIRWMLIGGEYVITNVKRCAADIVPQWSVIKKFNGLKLNEYIEKNAHPYIWHEKADSAFYSVYSFLRDGPSGSTAELEIEHNGKRKTVTLTRTKGDVDWVHTDPVFAKPSEDLSPVYRSCANSHQISMTKDNIAVITIDTMANNTLHGEFLSNFSLLQKARGYVIDIRNNGGGSSANSNAVTAAFIEGEFEPEQILLPVHIGTYKAWSNEDAFLDKPFEDVLKEFLSEVKEYFEDDCAAYDQLEKSYKIPKRTYYQKFPNIVKSVQYEYPDVLKAPLVVLSSQNTASAAEDFLLSMNAAKRATIVGCASNGSTGQPLLIPLESGGWARICTIKTLHPDGQEFTNIGVKPHIPCEMTIDDYKNGVDSVMDRGLSEVRARIK